MTRRTRPDQPEQTDVAPPDVTSQRGRLPARATLIEGLLDELTSWTPRDRFRMLGAWHQSGLSLAQLNVVTLLEMHGPMPMGRVAEMLGVSVASATGIVDRMTERDLVERKRCPTDRRVVEVHIADRAHDLFEAAKERRRGHLREVLDRVDEERLAGLLEGLRAVRTARAELEHEHEHEHQHSVGSPSVAKTARVGATA